MPKLFYKIFDVFNDEAIVTELESVIGMLKTRHIPLYIQILDREKGIKYNKFGEKHEKKIIDGV